MSEVDLALARATNDEATGYVTADWKDRDRITLADEVKRLRNLVVAQQAAMDQFMARIQHALKELEADDDADG